MRLRTRILLGAAAAVVLFVVAIVLVVPRFLQVDRYRPTLEKIASERLGREVHLGAVSLRLLPAASLRFEGVRVAARDEEGGGDFLRAADVSAGVALLPLLHKEVQIRSIVVEDPYLLLYRNPEGDWNLQEVLAGRETGKPRGGLAVSIGRLAVRSGSVRVVDATVGPGKPRVTQMENVDLEMDGLDSSPPFDVDVSAVLPGGGRFAWRGRVGPGAEDRIPVGGGTVTMKNVSLAPVAPYVREFLGLDLRGTLTSDLRLSHSKGGPVEASGKVEASGLLLPDRMRRALDVSVDVEGTVQPDASAAELSRLRLRAGDLEVAGSGSWRRSAAETSVRMRIGPSRVDPAALRSLLSAAAGDLSLRGFGDEAFTLGGDLSVLLGEGGKLRRIEARGVRLQGATLVLERGRDGALLLPGLGAAGAGKAARHSSGSETEVVLQDLAVRDTAVRFTDRSVQPTARLDLQGVQAEIGSWGEGKASPLRIEARLGGRGGGTFRLEGSVGPFRGGHEPVDLSLEARDVPGTAIAPYLVFEGAKVEGGSATVKLDRFKGDLGATTDLTGSFALDKVDVRLPSRKEPVRLDFGGDLAGRILRGGDAVDLQRFQIKAGSSVLKIAGSLSKEKAGLAVKARFLEPARIDAADAEALLLLAGSPLPFEMETHDPMSVSGSFARTAAGKVTVDGGLDLGRSIFHLKGLSAPFEVESAHVAAGSDRATVNLGRGRIGGSDVRGTFTVEGFQMPKVSFEAVSDRAELAELLSFLEREPGGAGKGAGGDDLVSRTTAHGTLRIGEGTFEKLSFRDLQATLELRGHVATLDPLTLALYGGNARTAARFDLSAGEPSYSFQGRLEGVDLNALLSATTGYPDLHGAASGDFDLRGHGTGVETAARNAQGAGKIAVKDGRVDRLQVFKSVTQISGLLGERSLATLSRQLARNGTEFSLLSATYQVAGGLVRSQDILMLTPEATITGKGTVDILSGRLDLENRVAFSREISQAMREEDSAAYKLFWEPSREQVVVPVAFQGPLSSPRPTLPGGTIVELLARKRIQKEVGGVLGNILGDGTARQAGGSGDGGPTPGGEKPAEGGVSGPSQAAAAVEAGPKVAITSHRLSGNFLVPDLRFEGTLEGTDLAGGDLEIKDEKGRVLLRQPDAFPEVGAWYAEHPRTERAAIPFSRKLDARKLGVAGEYHVTVTLRDRAGRTDAASFTEARSIKSLF